MKKNKRVWFIIIPLLVIIAFMLKDSFTQKSIEDLPGDFKEVAFVRNDQNKGEIIRIYAISVGNPSAADYQACIDLLPVNDYGSTTTAYFFDKNMPYPTTLTLEAPHYDGKKYEAIQISKKTGSDKE
ncbi:hypothetical protein LZQ00_09660 [Sphingobacterium sp. SRCM116780]|uniref:hypothetical protein n=1 Tax=Sphingobacterium sp. SRCM116780 TaxID=2907623 RepID=UPI001F402FA4|nr:hypothetical protein [Sphingobacterium sp. SRCM116780]UIR54538.1 hypothetical protein LZQ00_09660 [Sphingobacterium sp. SRCM116780]